MAITDFSTENRISYIASNGELYVSGRAGYGEDGMSGYNPHALTKSAIPNVKKAIGSMVLDHDGVLWGKDANSYGQLGLGHTNGVGGWTQIASDVKDFDKSNVQTYIIKNDNSLWATGKDILTYNGFSGDALSFTPIDTNIVSLHVFMNGVNWVKSDNSLWGFGANSYGERGCGYTNDKRQITTNVKKYIHNWYNSYVIKTDDSFFVAGRNSSSQLGAGHATDIFAFQQVASSVKDVFTFQDYSCKHLFILKTDNTLWASGDSNAIGVGGNYTIYNQFIQVLSGVKDVRTDNNNTLAIKTDNTLWGTGGNNSGMLGTGNTSSSRLFIQVSTNVKEIQQLSYSSSLIRKLDNSLWQAGKIGGPEVPNFTVFTQILSNVVETASVGDSYWVLKEDGQVLAAGVNNGTLRLGHEIQYVNTWSEVLTGVKSIPVIGQAIKTDFSLWVTDTPPIYYTFTRVGIKNVKNIIQGKGHTFILKDDSTLWAIGSNKRGQLGAGDQKTRTTFTQVLSNVREVGTYNEWYSYAIKHDNTLWVTGYNVQGQLGLGDTTERSVFTQSLVNVTKVVHGHQFLVALTTSGQMMVAGIGNFGQIGNGTSITSSWTQKLTNVANIEAGFNTSYALKTDGTLWASGRNGAGEFGLGHNTMVTQYTQIATDVKKVVTNKDSSKQAGVTFIIKNDNTLWASGENSSFNLGVGGNSDRNTFALSTTNVKDVYVVGDISSFVVKNDNTLWGVGAGHTGKLGLPSALYTEWTKIKDTTPIKIMHDAGNSLTMFQDSTSIWVTGNNSFGVIGQGETVISIEIFTEIFLAAVYHLFRDQEGVKTLVSDAWSLVPGLTSSSIPMQTDFESYGLKDLKSITLPLLQSLIGSSRILYWSEVDNTRDLSMVGTMKPKYRYKVETITPHSLVKDWTSYDEIEIQDSVTIPASLLSENPRTQLKITVESIGGTVEEITHLISIMDMKLYVSRDKGVNWKEVQPDQLVHLKDLPEGKDLKIKVVLTGGNEVNGISYSWI